MQFSPEFPYFSANSRLLNEKHACGGAESRREEMWYHYVQMESLTC